ncbi:cytochrome C oxidase assembly protein [Sulfolobus tengchongensis]|uniref:Cytochrome C oxidase assembly protein n=1 Tax=Sulfolobus tengchongensis TaxID=207809 RepID=A0AAX4KZK5_9CREN
MILTYISGLEAILAGTTIVFGGIVEGYGYGLSLGTNWPYTHDIMQLAAKRDPEAIHRILATIVGIISLIILIIHPSLISIIGFVAVIFTALLGMATLYVLAGKLPSVFQGLHDIAAYTTFVSYLLITLQGLGIFKVSLVSFLISAIIPPHFLYFVIFMGGVVTGTRRMKLKIGRPWDNSDKERNIWLQVAWTIHGILALIFIIAVVLLHYWLTLGFTILEIIAGLWVWDSTNRNPLKPGISVALHQLFSILVVIAIILNSIS